MSHLGSQAKKKKRTNDPCIENQSDEAGEEENNSELEKDDATVDEDGAEDEGTILHESNDDYEEENDQFCKLDPRNVVGAIGLAIGDGNPIKTLADLHNIY